MAVMNGHFFSVALHRNVPFSVAVPTTDYGNFLRKEIIDIPRNVLILFSGIGEKYDIWYEKYDIEKRAQETDTIVVLIEQYNSFAVDVGIGKNYFTYFHNELFNMVEQIFHSSLYVKRYYLAGISLGGYNVLKIGLCSKKIDGIFAFSSIINPYAHIKENSQYLLDSKEYIDSFFGASDISVLPLKKGFKTTRYYIYCGTKDEYYNENFEFYKEMLMMDYEVKFIPIENQKHNWECWNFAYENMWKEIEKENL